MGERRMGEEVVTVFREGENRDLGEELRGVNDVDMWGCSGGICVLCAHETGQAPRTYRKHGGIDYCPARRLHNQVILLFCLFGRGFQVCDCVVRRLRFGLRLLIRFRGRVRRRCLRYRAHIQTRPPVVNPRRKIRVSVYVEPVYRDVGRGYAELHQ
jgi:hypothetical protein